MVGEGLNKKKLYGIFLFLIILLGVFLRLKGLIINPSMWHDECALGWNVLHKNYFELFSKLRFMQIAPPMFLVMTKFLVNLFGVSNKIGTCDLVMRLIPFLCATLSIGVFYLICKNTFKSKSAVLLAVFLFAINNVLVDYSFEFKQYGPDMFFILLIILFFQNLDLAKISTKKFIGASVAMAVLVWFSFVSVFAVAAGGVNLLLERKKIKKTFLMFLPLFISVLLYLKIYILNTYQSTGQGMIGFWEDNFVAANFSNFLLLLVKNLQYFFHPVKYLLFILILSLYGVVLLYRDKKYTVANISVLIFCFSVLASVGHIYPFSQRLIIFLIPIFIILLVKPIDELKSSSKIKSLIIFIMFLGILVPQLDSVFRSLFTNNLNKGDFARKMTEVMVKEIKPSDIIFLNNGSIADFSYYSSFYDIKNNLVIKTNGDSLNQDYFNLLNGLKKGNYWFYLSYDYNPSGEIISYLKNWAAMNTKILYLNEASISTLIYVSLE